MWEFNHHLHYISPLDNIGTLLSVCMCVGGGVGGGGGGRGGGGGYFTPIDFMSLHVRVVQMNLLLALFPFRNFTCTYYSILCVH